MKAAPWAQTSATTKATPSGSPWAMPWAPPTVAVKEIPTESTLAQHLEQNLETQKVEWWEAQTVAGSGEWKGIMKDVQKAFESVPRWD